jgi:hypothetical protein
MNINEVIIRSTPNIVDMIGLALPVIMKHLDLKSLPTIKLKKQILDREQPTFGQYVTTENTIYLALNNRHPVDILRTFAHEMVHYSQDLKQELDHTSGRTGSPAENEAHAVAGVIMRHINKLYPEFMSADNIELP